MKLRTLAKLQTINGEKTRWLSKMAMNSSFLELFPFLESLPRYSKIFDNISSARQITSWKALGGTLEKLHSVTVALQSENLKLQDARILFDEIMNDNTENEFEKYLSTTSHLVDKPNFESSVRKVLCGLENALSVDETASVSMLLRDL